jgi:predicted transcriptional regulator
MDIKAEKLDLIQWLAQLTDVNVIEQIKALRKEKSDWWQEISEEERAEIEEGLAQADRGEVKSHEEVMAKYDKADF